MSKWGISEIELMTSTNYTVAVSFLEKNSAKLTNRTYELVNMVWGSVVGALLNLVLGLLSFDPGKWT